MMNAADWAHLQKVRIVPPEGPNAFQEWADVTVNYELLDDNKTLVLMLWDDLRDPPKETAPVVDAGFPAKRPTNAVAWVSTPHSVRGMDTFARGLALMYGPGLVIKHAPGGYWVLQPDQPDDGGPIGDKADLAEPVKEDVWHTPPEQEPLPPRRHLGDKPRRDDDPVLGDEGPK